MTLMMVDIEKIRIDGGTQSREKLDEAVVAEYAESIDDLPPVTVFFDGSDSWLADGFHRYHATRKAGRDELPANVLEGTRRDAVLYSVGANQRHGLRRKNEDKRRAVQTLLEDAEWSGWSDNKIAEMCGVSVSFVGAIRRPEVAERQKQAKVDSAKRSLAGLQEFETEQTTVKLTEEIAVVGLQESEKSQDNQGFGHTDIAALTAENKRLSDELEHVRENARELAALLESYDAVTAGEHEAAKAMNALRAQLRTVEATRDQWMTAASQLKREVKALQAKLKKAGL